MNSLIITGCTNGLGRVFHDKAVSSNLEKIQCVFLGRKLERLKQSTEHVYYEIDFSHEVQIDWNKIYSSKLPKSITLISNAGVITPLGVITSDKYAAFRESAKVNLIAPSELTSSLVLWAKSYNIKVTIINISTGAASRAIAGWGAYCMSKAGFKIFLDVVALEHENVDVIHFDPGVIDTNMQKIIRAASIQDVPLADSFRALAVENKLKSPEEVVGELFRLCDFPL